MRTLLAVSAVIACAAFGPFIPFLLLVRHGRTQMKKGNFSRYLRAAPAAAILTFAVSIALRAIGLAGLGVYGLAAGIASYPVLNSLVLSRLLARKLDRT